jgi:hypothetical protein
MSKLDATLGAIEIGGLLSLFMFGLFNLQVFRYYRNYPKDSWALKSMVAFQWILEFTHAVFICHAIYVLTITDYMSPEIMERYPWSLSLSSQFNGLIIFCAQTFFATRIYKCFESPYIPSFCWLLSFLHVIGVTALTVYSMTMPAFHNDHHSLNWLITTTSVIGATADTIIAASLCFYLFNERRNSVSTKTHRIVDRFIATTMPTGLATCIAAIVLIICLLTLQHTFVWLGVLMFKAELFSNSMLANLNNRSILRRPGERKETTIHSTQLQSIHFVHGDGDVAVQSVEVALDISRTDSSSADDRKDVTKVIDV